MSTVGVRYVQLVHTEEEHMRHTTFRSYDPIGHIVVALVVVAAVVCSGIVLYMVVEPPLSRLVAVVSVLIAIAVVIFFLGFTMRRSEQSCDHDTFDDPNNWGA